MSVAVSRWADLLEGEELAYLGTEPSQAARLVPLPAGLDPRVVSALVGLGVTSLYTHQADAWEAAARGDNVIVTTGTASGKSLAFNLPVADAIARDPKTRALYLYPTKALAQDQARALAALELKGLRPAIYDGDTESERRWQIRKWANVILTNPDMLHLGVLPHHDRWGDVFANLRFVVVDEAHVYRGVFGSHVANVLRRLRRIARALRRRPAVPARVGDDRQRGRAGRGADRRAAPSSSTVTARRAPSARSRSGTRRSSIPSSGCARARSARRPGCSPVSSRAGSGRSASRRAARRPSSSTASPPSASTRATARRDLRPTGPATRPSSGARSSGGSSRASCSASPQPMRSSSGSTSACSTARSRSGFPAPSPRCASSGAAPAGARHGLGRAVCSEDALDQFFARDPEALLSAARRGGAPRPCQPADPRAACLTPPRTRRRSTSRTPRSSAPRRSSARPRSPELEQTPAGWVWKGRDYPAARISLRSGDGEAFTVVDDDDRRPARPGRAGARLLDRARRSDLPPSRRAVPRASHSISTRAPRSSRRSPPTGTPR